MTTAAMKLERDKIEEALNTNNRNISATARILNVSRHALHRRMRRLGIDICTLKTKSPTAHAPGSRGG